MSVIWGDDIHINEMKQVFCHSNKWQNVHNKHLSHGIYAILIKKP